MSEKLEITFALDKPTKNTIRYAEMSDNPVVGTLYVQKSAIEKLENPKSIKVTIEAA
ncbi:MAG: hypothetical protein Q8O55_08880 [Dehalococcoidales bacterium]|nr:hypothetical protein [Dehalococcoidales bacterium]